MNFYTELKRRAEIVNTALEELIPQPSIYPGIIHEAVRYSLLAGGKRIRPVLALSTAELLGGDVGAIMPAACALELIHTYSLIHDDLPAMDNDDLRRGMPTCHKKYGEAIAILAGDALLTMAFGLIARCPLGGRVTEKRLLQVVAEISEAAGTLGLIGGQVVDIMSDSDNIDDKTLAYIHKNKTGAMFRTAVRTGAILSGAGERDLDRLTSYAEHAGMAFQIADDILDIIGDEKNTGKTAKSDLKNKKATYPSLYGMERAAEMAEEEMKAALGAIGEYGERADFLREMIRFMVLRNH
ncbi:MAG: polyprenyl synthetase family protein [Bacillota bacterium]